jgi:hypothetical protein
MWSGGGPSQTSGATGDSLDMSGRHERAGRRGRSLLASKACHVQHTHSHTLLPTVASFVDQCPACMRETSVPPHQNVDCRTFRFAQRATARENFWRLLSHGHARFALVKIHIVRAADISVAAQRSRQNVVGLPNVWSARHMCGARCRCRTLVVA